MKKTKSPAYDFSTEEIKNDLRREARALRVHTGFAELIIEKVLLKTEEYVSTHPVVTKKDIDKIIYRELKKYHKDLAYMYLNRERII